MFAQRSCTRMGQEMHDERVHGFGRLRVRAYQPWVRLKFGLMTMSIIVCGLVSIWSHGPFMFSRPSQTAVSRIPRQQMRVSTLNACKARKKNDSVTRWTCLIEGWYWACEGLNGFQQRFRRIEEETSRRHENWGLKWKPEGLRWFEMVWGNRLCGLLVWNFCDQKYRGLLFRTRFGFVDSIVIKLSLSFERK